MSETLRPALIARFDGRGRVTDGDADLGEVTYALKEIEEVADFARGGEQDARVLETRTLAGLLTSPQLETFAPYVGQRLTLTLDDGRRFDFAIARMSDTFLLIKALSALSAPDT